MANWNWTRHVCASALALFALNACLLAQQQRAEASPDTNRPTAPETASPSDSSSDVKALADSVAALQAEIRALNSQIADLRAAQAHSAEEVQALQEQLLSVESKNSGTMASAVIADTQQNGQNSAAAAQSNAFATPMNSNAPSADQDQPQSLADRVSQLEEGQELVNSKLEEQSQTKVASGSKYRV
ncbi:MAG TPA: hypothetical protein VIY69_15495, partial [Candidatus Acidoferrales bacterium]